MAKILVRVADGRLAQDIAAALTESNKRNTVVVGAPLTAADSPRAAAQELLDSKASVIVLDYLPEDAASVKLLQASTEVARIPHFVFIMPDEFDIGHVLMAVNEGAAAMIERPVKLPSLVNYVERALSGPGRWRHDYAGDSSDDDVADLERQIQLLRQFASACQRLISYVLSTPLADQSRKALIVSDSPYQRDILKKVLEYHAFSVLVASSAAEGIATALAEKPLIVISDLELGDKNGIEFCHALKIENKFVPCHFVICTANREKIDTILAPGNGVDDCVIKSAADSDYRDFLTRAALGLLLEEAKKGSSMTQVISR